jgi:hypothetical protein
VDGFTRASGGAKSEGQWREEFYQNGLMIEEPEITSVEVGIQRVYSLFACEMLFAFDDLDMFWTDLFTYSYETDAETGAVLPELKIIDQNSHHAADALRYLCAMFPEGMGLSGDVARGGGEQPSIEYFNDLQGRLMGSREITRIKSERPVRSGRIGGRGAGNGFGRALPSEVERLRRGGILW